MIVFGDYRFCVGQIFDTGFLGFGIVEGVRNGRLVVRLPGRLLNGKRKRKIPRCRYSLIQLRSHVFRGWCSFACLQLELFDFSGGAA